mmetsp:Transcript_30709/g.93866  ORF Transcript_30709/g.93866 Transcript_30709/m.93866 type:complete len:272 (+) Transcript_30709:62-877(+)
MGSERHPRPEGVEPWSPSAEPVERTAMALEGLAERLGPLFALEETTDPLEGAVVGAAKAYALVMATYVKLRSRGFDGAILLEFMEETRTLMEKIDKTNDKIGETKGVKPLDLPWKTSTQRLRIDKAATRRIVQAALGGPRDPSQDRPTLDAQDLEFFAEIDRKTKALEADIDIGGGDIDGGDIDGLALTDEQVVQQHTFDDDQRAAAPPPPPPLDADAAMDTVPTTTTTTGSGSSKRKAEAAPSPSRPPPPSSPRSGGGGGSATKKKQRRK